MLDSYLAERRSVPFAWGLQDCCTFAADWVSLRTGRDPMVDLRGLTSAKQAMRQMQALGGFLAAGAQRLGDPIGPLFAQVGDVCLLPTGPRQTAAKGWAFGICNGSLPRRRPTHPAS